MAYATEINSNAQGDLGNRFSALFTELRNRIARRRIYRQTFRELSTLTSRELADLGLSRSEIRRVAYQAAYEA